MKILAFEFSSPQRSVALVQKVADSEASLEYEAVETGSQTGKPFELIEEVLKQARLEREQIDGLAVGLGPGSYTGIRAAIALAQGWQLGRELHLYGVSSAESVAAQAHVEGLRGRVAVVIDAQRGEFYLANYDLTSTGWNENQPLRLASQAMVAACEIAGDRLVGPEVTNWFPGGRTLFPRAAILGRVALNRPVSISGEFMEPIYLRETTFVKAAPPRVLPE